MVTNNQRDERREFERTPVNFLVYFRINAPVVIRIQVGDKELVALAADISEGGMAIMTDRELPPVTSVTINFFMLNDKAYSTGDKGRAVTVRGEVRYNIIIKERKEYKTGIMFSDLTDDNRNFIRQFVSMNKKAG